MSEPRDSRVDPELRAIPCEGAPRDLGWDQGHALREELAAAYARSSSLERLGWRLGRLDGLAARVARDLARHLPRQAETLDGMARAAGVPAAWLTHRLTRAFASAPAPTDVAGAAAGLARGAGETALGRVLAGPARVRRARPEGGIECLELAPPWFTGALAAVSEAGIAGAVVTRGGLASSHCAAPAALLLQDALHRMASLAAVLEWLLRRPGGGDVSILLADAEGELAEVAFERGGRRVRRPADGSILSAESPERASALAKALGESDAGAAALARALGGRVVLLDPVARRLRRVARGKPEAEPLSL